MYATLSGEKDIVDLLIKQSDINLDLQVTGNIIYIMISTVTLYNYNLKIVNC